MKNEEKILADGHQMTNGCGNIQRSMSNVQGRGEPEGEG